MPTLKQIEEADHDQLTYWYCSWFFKGHPDSKIFVNNTEIGFHNCKNDSREMLYILRRLYPGIGMSATDVYYLTHNSIKGYIYIYYS